MCIEGCVRLVEIADLKIFRMFNDDKEGMERFCADVEPFYGDKGSV